MIKSIVKVPNYDSTIDGANETIIVNEKFFQEYLRWQEEKKNVTTRKEEFFTTLKNSIRLINENSKEGSEEEIKEKIIKGTDREYKFIIKGSRKIKEFYTKSQQFNYLMNFIGFLLTQREDDDIKRKYVNKINNEIYLNNNHLIDKINQMNTTFLGPYEKRSSFGFRNHNKPTFIEIVDSHDYSILNPDNAQWVSDAQGFLGLGKKKYDDMSLHLLATTVDNLGIEFPELRKSISWFYNNKKKKVKDRNEEIKNAKSKLARIIASPESYLFTFKNGNYRTQLEPRIKYDYNKLLEKIIGNENNPGLLLKIREAEKEESKYSSNDKYDSIDVRLRKSPEKKKEAYINLESLKEFIEKLKVKYNTSYIEQNIIRIQ